MGVLEYIPSIYMKNLLYKFATARLLVYNT